MQQNTAPDSQRILLLKVALKLMMLSMAIAVALMMGWEFLPKGEPPPVPLRVNITQLGVGATQGVEWNHRRLLIVHTFAGANYLVISDYDPLYGCPLRWIAAASAEAPNQPWPGGLRAICTEHWFDATGTSLSKGVANLKPIPFTLDESGNLVISAVSE